MAGQRRGPEGADGGGAAVPVFLPHPGEVTLVVAPGDETGQNVLLQRRDRTGIEAQLLPVAFQQPGRQHQKAKTHRGGNGLGKGVQVNDPAPVIDALQGGDGTASVAELAVIVILDDGGAGILCPSQKGLPPGDGGHQSGGVLVVGGDVQRPRLGSHQRHQFYALIIQRDGDAGGSAGVIDLTDLGIAGVLHGEHRVPAQQLGQQ